MKRLKIVILVFAIFFLIAPVAHGATPDYTALKNDYIKNHPGQSIIPFPWETSTSIKVLPINYIVPASPANNLSITACRDQFESASFIITAQKDLSNIGITVPNLYSAQGNSIPADAINVRLVKAWYQADDSNVYISHPGSRFLTPELLLKDDSLVKVDYVNKINSLKVTINGVQQYIDISNPSGTFPANAQFQDAASLQPFSLAMNENKQIWLNIHVPATTPSGDYYGNITLTTPSEAPVTMMVKVTVLPFALEPSPLEYAMYYRGGLTSDAQPGISADFKTPAQYATELKDMKEHGIMYPTFYQNDWTLWSNALTVRQQSGLPTDHIYVVEWGTGNPTDAAGLAALQHGISVVKNLNAPFGYKDTYIYGKDEAQGDTLLSERPAWQATHDSGAKVFVAVFDDAVDKVGDLLDVAVLDGPLDATQTTKWHSYGKKVLSFDNPQIGVENPELYRKNFGFALWSAGYDGAMDYAYQHQTGGSLWNDFDDSQLRDHVFAYPTSNGVIDTIQWEGWREGVDDTRYLTSATKQGVSASSVRTVVTDSLANGDSMAATRLKVISQIPVAQTPIPTPTPSPTVISTPVPTPTPTPIPTITPVPTPTKTPAPSTTTVPTGTPAPAPTPLLTVSKPSETGMFSAGTWTLDSNGDGVLNGTDKTVHFGTAGDLPVVGDWNNDSSSEIGVFRPSNGNWYLDYNADGVVDKTFHFGKNGDIPLVGDWNGDRITDAAVFRPSNGNWYLDYDFNGVTDTSFHFGTRGDIPLVADWNKDGKADVAVFRPSSGTWYLETTKTGAVNQSFRFGTNGDKPVVGDWNDDGMIDVGVFRPSSEMWYLDTTRTSVASKSFYYGLGTDVPLAGDWNGDGTADIGVFRPSSGNWYLDYSTDSGTDKSFHFGKSGDTPVIGTWA